MKALEYTTKAKSGETLKLGLFSDIHFDSPDCDKETLKKHLDSCLREGRYILFGGDFFDAILLRDKKRAVNHLMEATDNQLNVKIENAYEFLLPYAALILFMGRGNHEESTLKYNGLDLLQMLTALLNANAKTNIQLGNYSNFIRFSWHNKCGKKILSYDIYQTHGYGGNSPVTKGMIDFNRIAKGVNADLIWIGHKHNSIVDYSDPVLYIDNTADVLIKNRQCIQTPSYQKGRTIDPNINFAERFYTHQAMSGYGKIDLTPRATGTHYELESDVKIINRPIAKCGELVKLELKKKQRQKER